MTAEKRHSKDWALALEERTAQADRKVAAAAGPQLLRAMPEGLALVAVGGFGRRELFPASDVDVLLLFASHNSADAAQAAVGDFVRRVWDEGLRLSHSVQTPAACASLPDHNPELSVSLLDQRFLCGDRALYDRLATLLPRTWRAQRDRLAGHLAKLTRERHARFQQTYHHLEPNIKDGPGGLRDYNVVRWLARIRQSDEEPAPELRAAFAFLVRLRLLLHERAGRDHNLLTFEAQECAAAEWGASPAAWMREYFRHARTVARAAERALDAAEGRRSALLAGFRDWRARLSNADFIVSRDRLYFRAPLQLEAAPELALAAFEFVARHGVRLSAEAEQRLADALPRLAEWSSAPRPLWPVLRRIFTLPDTPAALAAMHETGVLGALFPELNAIDCLVVRDFFHRYTVDEHSLAAVRNLVGLRAEREEPQRRFAELLSEIEDLAPLVFALLFHDVGKAQPDAPHVPGSLDAASAAMARIEMPERDRETVELLIRHHLVMPAMLQTRDIRDPATARELAPTVGTVERLKALVLVSYADVSAVYPGAMTPWRAGELWQLYMAAYNQLTRGLQTERIAPEAPFLEGFPARYLRTHSEEEIRAHLALEERSRARGAAAELCRVHGAWRMTLVARNRPGLFAAAAGTLATFGMNIRKAEAYSNRSGGVLDEFVFEDPLRTLELNPSEVNRLRLTAERAALGKVNVAGLLANRAKPAVAPRRPRLRPSVAFDGEVSGSATLLQIVAEDRPGLLYDLASAISAAGCDIDVVLVDTEAHKAIDVFYLRMDGGKLPAEVEERLAAELRAICGD